MTDESESIDSDDEGLEAAQDEIDEEPGAGLGPGDENDGVEPVDDDGENGEEDANDENDVENADDENDVEDAG